MVFSKEDEVVFQVLHQEKGFGVTKKFINKSPNRNWSPSSLNKLLTKISVSSVRRGLHRTLTQSWY